MRILDRLAEAVSAGEAPPERILEDVLTLAAGTTTRPDRARSRVMGTAGRLRRPAGRSRLASVAGRGLRRLRRVPVAARAGLLATAVAVAACAPSGYAPGEMYFQKSYDGPGYEMPGVGHHPICVAYDGRALLGRTFTRRDANKAHCFSTPYLLVPADPERAAGHIDLGIANGDGFFAPLRAENADTTCDPWRSNRWGETTRCRSRLLTLDGRELEILWILDRRGDKVSVRTHNVLSQRDMDLIVRKLASWGRTIEELVSCPPSRSPTTGSTAR